MEDKSLNRRQHQGGGRGDLNAERVSKTWRLLFRAEQMGEMTHKPEQSQEPQHLKCGVIVTNNVGAAKKCRDFRGFGNSSFIYLRGRLLRNSPEVCYWQMNPWNVKTGAREMRRWIREIVLLMSVPMGLTEKGRWAKSQDWQGRWEECRHNLTTSRLIAKQMGATHTVSK